jgi:hypothetical protein
VLVHADPAYLLARAFDSNELMRNTLLPLILAGAATVPAGCATIGADREPAADLRPVTVPGLAGEWRIVSSGGRALADRAFSLNFGAGGLVTGTLNSNTLSGTYFEIDQRALGCSGGESERLGGAGRTVWKAAETRLSGDGQVLVFQGILRVTFCKVN